MSGLKADATRATSTVRNDVQTPVVQEKKKPEASPRRGFVHNRADARLRSMGCGGKAPTAKKEESNLQEYQRKSQVWLKKVKDSDIRDFAKNELGIQRALNPREKAAIHYLLAARKQIAQVKIDIANNKNNPEGLDKSESDIYAIDWALLRRNDNEQGLRSLTTYEEILTGAASGGDYKKLDIFRGKYPIGSDIQDKLENMPENDYFQSIGPLHDEVDRRIAHLDPKTARVLRQAFPQGGDASTSDTAKDYATALWKLGETTTAVKSGYAVYLNSGFDTEIYRNAQSFDQRNNFKEAENNWQKAKAAISPTEAAAFAKHTAVVEKDSGEMKAGLEITENAIKGVATYRREAARIKAETEAQNRTYQWNSQLYKTRGITEFNFKRARFNNSNFAFGNGTAQTVEQYGKELQSKVGDLEKQARELADKIAIWGQLPDTDPQKAAQKAGLKQDAQDLNQALGVFVGQMRSFRDNSKTDTDTNTDSVRRRMYHYLPDRFTDHLPGALNSIRKFIDTNCLEPTK